MGFHEKFRQKKKRAHDEDPFSEKVIAQRDKEGLTLNWLEMGLASAESGNLKIFGLCMGIVLYLKPSRKEEIREYKETILNDYHIRHGDINLFNRLARKYAVPERVRDWVLSEVEQERTDWFYEPNPVMSKRLEELKDGDEKVRMAATVALGKLSDRAAIPALIEALKKSEDPWLQTYVAAES